MNTEVEKRTEEKPFYDFPLQHALRKWMEMVMAMTGAMGSMDIKYRYPAESDNELNS